MLLCLLSAKKAPDPLMVCKWVHVPVLLPHIWKRKKNNNNFIKWRLRPRKRWHIQMSSKIANSAGWGAQIVSKLPTVSIKMTQKNISNGHSGELAFCSMVTEAQFLFLFFKKLYCHSHREITLKIPKSSPKKYTLLRNTSEWELLCLKISLPFKI